MKKRIVSAVCAAAFAAVITFACVGAEPAEASQPDKEEIVVEVFGPYLMETVDGVSCFECEVLNESDEDIYIGVTYYLYDASGAYADTLYTYNPCVAPGGSVCLCAKDYNGVYEHNGSVAYMLTYNYAGDNFESAAADLNEGLSYTEENGCIEFSVMNHTQDTIYMPEIIVIFYSEDYSQYWAGSAPLTYTGIGLASGTGAVIDVPAPQGYYGWYYSLGGFYSTEFVPVDAEDAGSGIPSDAASQLPLGD